VLVPEFSHLQMYLFPDGVFFWAPFISLRCGRKLSFVDETKFHKFTFIRPVFELVKGFKWRSLALTLFGKH